MPQHNLRLFADLGFRLFQVDLFLEHVWPEPDRFDMALARQQIRGVLEASPEAAVFLRLHVNAPRWWAKAHPDEWVAYADVPVHTEDEAGFHRIIEYDNGPVSRVSLASRSWLQETSEKVAQFCRELAATDEGGALAGIHLACGVYGEWHYWGFFQNEPDTGAAMKKHFRQWLRRRYGNDRKLQEAWGDPQVTLENAEVPGYEARARTRAGVFRFPQAERPVIDYFRCQHELVAENILHFCRIVKENWPRPIVTGTFYGYFFPMFGREAAGGHLELVRILESPWVDYLSGPQCYFPFSLEPGGAFRSRSLLESCRVHGKLWLDEMDQKPDLIWDPLIPGYRGSAELSCSLLRRNLAATLTRGHGLWLYDFGVGFANAGWWDHPILAEEIGRLHELFASRLHEEYRSEADVLVVYDTEPFYYTASTPKSDPVSRALVDETTLAVYLSGVACDQIHLSSLPRLDLSRYRVVIFANTFVLQRAQREFLRNRVASEGRHALFFFAPGYCDGQCLDEAYVSEVTGIPVRQIGKQEAPEIAVTYPEWTGERIRLETPCLEPAFAAVDPEVEILGTWRDGADAAFVRKVSEDGVRWWCALPITSPALMRKLLREAGAHIYGEMGDVFYSGQGLVCVHSKEGGSRPVRLRSGRSVLVELPRGGTAVLDASSGRVLAR